MSEDFNELLRRALYGEPDPEPDPEREPPAPEGGLDGGARRSVPSAPDVNESLRRAWRANKGEIDDAMDWDW